MKNKILITILFLSAVFGAGRAALGEEQRFIRPLQDAYIKYNVVGFQTYNFIVTTNLDLKTPLKYEWRVDGRDFFQTPTLRYYFTKGEHAVNVRVQDEFGNVATDSVNLKISFWSLQNNWFWWVIYLCLALVILYYWIIKLIYLFNKKKISRHARAFLDVLDEHGWVERMVKEHLKSAKLREMKNLPTGRQAPNHLKQSRNKI